MNLRESFASTHHANLGWNPDHERAIDKVAASGLCDELGVLLWKAKYVSESDAAKKALKELNKRVRERFTHHAGLILSKVVDQAFHEFMSDQCKVCGGRGQIKAGELLVVCETCDGTRIRRYSDFERARSMGLAYGQVETLVKHNRPFDWTLKLIVESDRRVNIQMNILLER